MANKHEDHLIQCPYYKTNTIQTIYCGKLNEDGMALRLEFLDHKSLIDHKGKFCRRSCYGECPLAKFLNLKHEYEV